MTLLEWVWQVKQLPSAYVLRPFFCLQRVSTYIQKSKIFYLVYQEGNKFKSIRKYVGNAVEKKKTLDTESLFIMKIVSLVQSQQDVVLA